jgi:hypothetical protein
MTIAICSNEHGMLWAFDDRLPHRWGRTERPTPSGEYVSIVAAFCGDPLEVVFLQETESHKILLADPKWCGILSYMGVELTYTLGQDWLLSHFPDFVSPHASRIKLMSLQYAQESKLPSFDKRTFDIKARSKYDLKPCQIKTAISYAERIHKLCKSDEEFAVKLDAIFSKIKSIDRMHLSSEMGEINYEEDAMIMSVIQPLIDDGRLTPPQSDIDYFLEGLDPDLNLFDHQPVA